MPLSSMCGHDTCATLLWCCPITPCPNEKFMSHNVSYVSMMLALPTVAPDAMCGASTMCAWTHTHTYIYIYPCMLRPVSTVDTERWLLFECICCDQHCFAARTIHTFSTSQDFSDPATTSASRLFYHGRPRSFLGGRRCGSPGGVRLASLEIG